MYMSYRLIPALGDDGIAPNEKDHLYVYIPYHSDRVTSVLRFVPQAYRTLSRPFCRCTTQDLTSNQAQDSKHVFYTPLQHQDVFSPGVVFRMSRTVTIVRAT